IHEQDPAGPASFDGVTTVTAGNGIDGEAAGDITLNITAFHSDGGPATRFILRGARGQDGGDHFGGKSGDSMDTYGRGLRTDVHGIVYTAPPGYDITYIKWTDYTALGAPIPLHEKGDPNKWPGDGSNAIAAGNAGDGGDAGQFAATLDLAAFADLGGGSRGDVESVTCTGGMPGDPDHAVRVWIDSVLLIVVKISDETHDAKFGRGWQTPPRSDLEYWGVDGSPTTFSIQGSPLDAIRPSWIAAALDLARKTYLRGDLAAAEETLSKYADLLNVLEDSWPEDVEYTPEQMNLLAMRDEMQGMLHRIAGGLDYFGNPAGWVPMLSFEVNKGAFEGEIDHALNIMYLAYLTRHAGDRIQTRMTGLQELWDALAEQTEEMQDLYAESVELIPWLHAEAERVKGRTEGVRQDIVDLVAELERQAMEAKKGELIFRAALSGAQLGLRISAVVMKAIPVGQPYLGAAGGIADIAGKFNIDDIRGSVLSSIGGTADVTASFADDLYKKKLEDVTKQVKGVDPKDAQISSRTATMRNFTKATTAMTGSVKGIANILGEYRLPIPDVTAEVEKLKAESDEFTTLSRQLLDLAEEKMILFERLIAANEAIVLIPNLIARNMFAMDAIQREIGRNQELFAPETIEHLDEIERRARERLLKYHYYMAKAYEYRLLKPYPGQLDLGPIVDKIVAMTDATTTAPIRGDQFAALKALYREQIALVAETIFDEYNSNRPELSVPVRFNLTQEELSQLNAGRPVKLNLMDIGVFLPSEENIRIVEFNVVDVSAVPEADPGRWAFLDVYMEHSGVSNIMRNGEVYRFRHYNALTENPIVWGARWDWYDPEWAVSIGPSAASDSLLRSLLSGDAVSDIMLYSRPGGWADIILTKDVNTETGADIAIDRLRLEVVYDFVRRRTSQAGLRVIVSEPGFQPHFIVSKPDLNERQDGRGGFYRTYMRQETVTVQAPERYGAWQFQKWTGPFGQDLGPQAGAGFLMAAARPANSLKATPWTDPVATVDLSDHRAIRAKYVLLSGPEQPAPADGDTNVPLGVTLDWEDVADATHYDVYLWLFDDAKPTSPTAAGLTTSACTPPRNLDANTSYTWQVVVWAGHLMAEGREWRFRTGERVFSPTPTPVPAATPTPEPEPIRALIRSFYEIILDRDAELGAVDSWHHGYFDYAVDFNIDVRFIPREMARLFFLSEEYAARHRSDAGFIADCYSVFLTREPTQIELDNWLGGAWNRSEVMTIFAESEEFASRIEAMYPRYGGNPTRNFVTTMYIGLLDRLVDREGLEYGAGLFDAVFASGGIEAVRAQAKQMTREVIVSEEFLSKNPTTAVCVSRFYRAFLGRFPSDAEATYWSGELDSGRQTTNSMIEI
ncbi:MAG TPA: DUF4214 domain-containing protein, partial [Sumerlaeia bacterium]|nr:DUF4214 domain-containing protein [Sumerlaeia bacterium]